MLNSEIEHSNPNPIPIPNPVTQIYHNGCSCGLNVICYYFSRVSWIVIIMHLVMCNILLVNAADPLCDIIAATNIQSIPGYSQWSCTAGGVASTPPCIAPLWAGISCSGINLENIAIGAIGMTG